MNKAKSLLSLLIAGLLLTNFITRNSFAASVASGAEVNTSAAEVGPELATYGGGISVSNAAPNPADVPVAESETNATNETVWGWYYNKTADEINQMGKQSNLRPITLVPNLVAESNPHFGVLFVRNAGVYKVDDWQVVASRTLDGAKQLETPAFRSTNWRVASLTWHKYQNNSPSENRLATILVRDNLYTDYDLRTNLTQAQLQALASKDQNFRVVDFDSYRDSQGHYLYAAVIVPNKGEHYKHWAWLFLTTKSNILNTAKKIDGKAFRVTDIERREDGKYDALLVESKGEATHWYSNLTDDIIYNDVLRRHGTWDGSLPFHGGVRFTDMVSYFDPDDKVVKYELMTMENGVGDYPVAHDNISVLKPIDDAFIRSMSRNGVPGATFALAKNGKVIYRAAYGYSNLNPAKAATINTRGRLASISKTITAAAIMKLVEEGKLSLEDTVFGPTGILKDLKPFSYSGYQGNNVATLGQIKVHHLLSHTGGWDRGTSGDPNVPVDADRFSCNGSKTGTECEPTISMAQYIAQRAKSEGTLGKNETRGASMDEVIRWMMRPDDPDFLPKWKPGEKQVYSNFGFIVLQKIIEVKSKQAYMDYIKGMMDKMGVTFAKGNSMPTHALANEWTYYDVPGAGTTRNPYWTSETLTTGIPWSYVYDMNTMLGHGGWVASPEELVKFVSKLDSTAPNPWITWKTFRSMMNRPEGAAKTGGYYGLNWSVDPLTSEADDKFHFSHGGALTGARSLLLKGMTDRKVSLAYLFNSSDENGEVGGALKNLIEDFDNKGVLANLAK
jgi:CubicO group peptidase (beta-lactamase class C family)